MTPDTIRIICDECRADVEIVWSERRVTMRSIDMHTRCRGADRFVSVDVRLVEQMRSFLWSQLIGPDANMLEESMQHEERDLVSTARRIEAMRACLSNAATLERTP